MSDYMEYLEGMEQIDSDIMDRVLEASAQVDFAFSDADVRRAIDAPGLARTPAMLAALLSPAAAPFLEEMAQAAQRETRAHFGNGVSLFTPLYIANYCENACVYCGFSRDNKIARAKLSEAECENEMKAIAASGLEEILILTGESRKMSDVAYIGKACETAQKLFRIVGVEIYPLNSDEYAYLHRCGVDFVTVFQETYETALYGELHPAGRKRIFPYRFNAQERALMGGIRGVGFAALLGLSDFRRDAYATGLHAFLLQRKYPHGEISFSCPRLRPAKNKSDIRPKEVGEAELLQILCAYRLFMPFANITISSRENARFRDQAVAIAATKISAGVDVGIGGHAGADSAADGGGGFGGADAGMTHADAGAAGTCADAVSVGAGVTVDAVAGADIQVNSHSETEIASDIRGQIENGGQGTHGDEQFEIDDGRSVHEIKEMLRAQGLQPVMSDYIYV
ncbi:MAG: 2-iminoacetate synthase ThiH [Clostridiales Family XIII bacterium]|nr:2-iminoacetate synthase ThiH [Clostridiales Family XIII bacterium]